MYQFWRFIKDKRIATEQGVIATGALIWAELMYKFHSFTLECLAFLATWLILDVTWSWGRRFWRQSFAAKKRA